MTIDTRQDIRTWYILPLLAIEYRYEIFGIGIAWLIWEVEINFD